MHCTEVRTMPAVVRCLYAYKMKIKTDVREGKNKSLNAKGRIICKNTNRELNLSGRKSYLDSRGLG